MTHKSSSRITVCRCPSCKAKREAREEDIRSRVTPMSDLMGIKGERKAFLDGFEHLVMDAYMSTISGRWSAPYPKGCDMDHSGPNLTLSPSEYQRS